MKPIFFSMIPMGRHCIVFCLLFMTGPAAAIIAAEYVSESSANKIAAKTISQNFGGYFSSSLQVRENSEAILMPAIVFQKLFDYYSTELSGHTMEFDSVMELSNSGDKSSFSLFAHYLVGSDSYQIAIVSANPEPKKINLTVPAIGLSFQSNSNTFSISHLYYTNLNRSFIRPFGEPPPFEYMYGDYQLSQLRFADQEALRRRQLIEEIRCAYRLQADTNRSKLSEQMLTNSDNRYSTAAKFSNGKLETLEVFSVGNTLDERVEYEYSGISDRSLATETIVLPEKTTLAGFQKGKTIRVNINDRVCEVKTFPLTFRRGGRVVAVKYNASMCDGLNLQFPTSIEVLCQTNGLRKINIQLKNFKYKTSDAAASSNDRKISNSIAKFGRLN